MTEKEIVIDMRELIYDISQKVNNGQEVVIKGQGESMLPFITDKDILTLTKPHKKIRIGEIYLYRRFDGRYAIHRVYAVKKDSVFMLGDAQLLIEKVKKSSLVAKVSTVKKPTENVDCNSFAVRGKCIIRMKSRIYKVKFKEKSRCLYFNFRHFLGKTKRIFIKKDK
jgi:hypothetical protein